MNGPVDGGRRGGGGVGDLGASADVRVRVRVSTLPSLFRFFLSFPPAGCRGQPPPGGPGETEEFCPS